MDEQLRGAMAELINLLTKGAEGLYEFGQEQIPEVLSQLLMWHATFSGIKFVVGVAAIVTIVCLIPSAIRVFKQASQYERGAVDMPPIFTLMGTAVAVAGVGSFSYSVLLGLSLDWMKILIAPKLYLLEYATQLVK